MTPRTCDDSSMCADFPACACGRAFADPSHPLNVMKRTAGKVVAQQAPPASVDAPLTDDQKRAALDAWNKAATLPASADKYPELIYAVFAAGMAAKAALPDVLQDDATLLRRAKAYACDIRATHDSLMLVGDLAARIETLVAQVARVVTLHKSTMANADARLETAEADARRLRKLLNRYLANANNLSMMVNTLEQEWRQQNCWSEWDQETITEHRAVLAAIDAAMAERKEAK